MFYSVEVKSFTKTYLIDNKDHYKPRVSCSPQLAPRPLVALEPFIVDVSSFPFSTFKVLELLLGFVVLFTVALLSTTCNEEKQSQAKN